MNPEEIEARIQTYIDELETNPAERVRLEELVSDCEIDRLQDIYNGVRSRKLKPGNELSPDWMDDPQEKELFRADDIYFAEVVMLFSHYLAENPDCLFHRPDFLGVEAFQNLVSSRFFRLDFFEVDIDVVETTIQRFDEVHLIIGHPDPELERFYVDETLSEPLKFFVLVQALIHSIIVEPYAPNGRLFNYTWAWIWAEIDARYETAFALELLLYFEKYDVPYLPREVGFVDALYLHPGMIVEDLRDKGSGLWLFAKPTAPEDLLQRALEGFQEVGLPARMDERERHVARRTKRTEKGICISREFDPSKVLPSLAVATLECVVTIEEREGIVL